MYISGLTPEQERLVQRCAITNAPLARHIATEFLNLNVALENTQTALSLAKSMIRSGEAMSEEAERVFARASAA